MTKIYIMKNIVFYLILLSCFCNKVQSQIDNDSLINNRMALAKSYLHGLGANRQHAKALEIYTECANDGNAEAMYLVGFQYNNGLGIAKNNEKAIEWYIKSANAGYLPAWRNLGDLYRAACDFEKAYVSYDKGAEANDLQSKYMKGYLLYKGLGCAQNYTQAATIFKEGAYKGGNYSMYFYGLCLRNGYGVAANIDSARYWLQFSASLGNRMAKEELTLKVPENIGNECTTLAEKIKLAQASVPNVMINKYQRVEHRINANEVAGTFTGYLLKYDWSGQNVIEANKLTVTLTKDKDSIVGLWKEDDSLTLPINAIFSSNALTFKQMKYGKTNHYSPTRPELTIFKQATLQLNRIGDSVYLSGNLEEFIPHRNEPSKPLYLALVRTSKCLNQVVTNEEPLHVYPNPFVSKITLDFELKENTKVSTELRRLDGKVIYSIPACTLSAGSYTLPIQTQQIAAGYYTLVLHCGNKIKTAKVVKL